MEEAIRGDVSPQPTVAVENGVEPEPMVEPSVLQPEAEQDPKVGLEQNEVVNSTVAVVKTPEIEKTENEIGHDSGVVPEESNAQSTVDEVPSEAIEPVIAEEPVVQQDLVLEQGAVVPETVPHTEHIVEDVAEDCPVLAAPVEVEAVGDSVLEPVITEEVATGAVLEEDKVMEEVIEADPIEKVNGMPVLTQEDGGAKANDEEANQSPAVEISETPPVEVKETTIPPHILGHAYEVDDEVRNGKVRKPRLGVKIPYRNLTSQIVSKQEIADEIMERSRLRNLNAETPEGGDIFFSKKLTKRLATKIASTSKNESSPSKKGHDSSHKSTGSSKSSTTSSGGSKKVIDSSSKINDSSDLLAILEGDDDWDLMRPKSKPVVEKRTPEWERETALKQLRELPKHRSYPKAGSSSHKTSPEKSKPSETTDSIDDELEEDPLEVPEDAQEPHFSMGLVTKTYTRKRKSSEDIKLLAATILQSQKKITGDKEKEKKTSTPHSEKSGSGSHPKLKTYSHKPSPKPDKHGEMPNLKPANTPVSQKHSTTSSEPPSIEKQPKLQPQNVTVKADVEPITPPLKVEKPIKQSSSSTGTYISKSSRIVKRKKIWDPDEDTTPKYFKVPSALKSPTEAVVEKKINSDTPPTKPAVLKPNNDKTPVIKKPAVKKVIMKKKKPKRLSEVDRLLMDEGAVNLLYAVKNTEQGDKKKKSVISLDRAERELQNKTNEIKNDLQINSTKDSPIYLRKKEGPSKTTPTKEGPSTAGVIQQRKKSTSSHSPPASPAFFDMEASRIIRRHSSSSFSSENPETEDGTRLKSDSQRKKVRARSERHSSSTFIIQQQDNDEEHVPDSKYSQFSTFTVVTFDNFVQIILSPSPTGQMNFSVDSLTELRAVLHLLENDDDCTVVLMTSSGKAFCDGLNYKDLYCNNRSECLNIAENYARCVRDFLISLLQFPKILVAGIHGNTAGLAVTMLPLFDMVLASDTAVFSAPYASLGCAAEGTVLFAAPHLSHTSLAAELFFSSRKLTASEALRMNLVTRTFWPDKFQAELLGVCKTIANQSQQSMLAMKMQLKDHLIADVETLLKSESSILVQHWTSKECQSNFMNYSASK